VACKTATITVAPAATARHSSNQRIDLRLCLSNTGNTSYGLGAGVPLADCAHLMAAGFDRQFRADPRSPDLGHPVDAS
jgi:hypothetical protein